MLVDAQRRLLAAIGALRLAEIEGVLPAVEGQILLAAEPRCESVRIGAACSVTGCAMHTGGRIPTTAALETCTLSREFVSCPQKGLMR